MNFNFMFLYKAMKMDFKNSDIIYIKALGSTYCWGN